jgi:hypothetical protein
MATPLLPPSASSAISVTATPSFAGWLSRRLLLCASASHLLLSGHAMRPPSSMLSLLSSKAASSAVAIVDVAVVVIECGIITVPGDVVSSFHPFSLTKNLVNA